MFCTFSSILPLPYSRYTLTTSYKKLPKVSSFYLRFSSLFFIHTLSIQSKYSHSLTVAPLRSYISSSVCSAASSPFVAPFSSSLCFSSGKIKNNLHNCVFSPVIKRQFSGVSIPIEKNKGVYTYISSYCRNQNIYRRNIKERRGSTQASLSFLSKEKNRIYNNNNCNLNTFSSSSSPSLVSSSPSSFSLPSCNLLNNRKMTSVNANASSLPSSTATAVMPKEGEKEAVSHVVLKPQKILKEKFRLDYSVTDFVIEHIDIKFELQDHNTKVSSKLLMYRRPVSSGSTTSPPTDLCDLKLDGEDLKLQIVKVNDKVLSYGLPESSTLAHKDAKNADENNKQNEECNGYIFEEDGNGLIINKRYLPTEPLEKFSVYTEVLIDPVENFQLMGLYKTGKFFCTQCEAEGFRRITYFLDRPDVMATYNVTIEGSKEQCAVMLSNGNLIKKGEKEEDKTRHFAVFSDPHPKPSYLFALIAGNLASIKDTFTTKSGRKVHIEILAEEEYVGKLKWAMHSIKKAFKWDEDTFNLEYDLDNFYIVCTGDFNMGAMENKGLNVFNAALLLADDKTTDHEYQRILNVIGHEYFHNWTGNRVTCRDWFQLTLKEGLTVYRDQLFTSDMYSHAQKRIEDVSFLKSKQFNEDSGPMAHPTRPESYVAMDNFYTATVYDKGAEVVRMYETILGKEGFKKGLALYFERHDGQAVTCEDFRFAMADSNNYDLTQFERWYLQAGTPEVEVLEALYVPETKTYKISFSQMTPPTPKQPVKLPLHIPIRIGLIGKQSKKDLIDCNTILHLKEDKQTFEIPDVSEDCIPSILRDFSAPVKLKNKFESDEDLAFLMAHDSDDFNRWEASQKFMIKLIIERINIFSNIFAEKYEMKLRSLGVTRDIMQQKENECVDNEKHDEIDNDHDVYDLFDRDTCDVYTHTEFKKLPPLFIKSFKTALLDENQDMALKAYSLSLPDEETLSNEVRPLDPLLIRKAILSVRREIFKELKDDILNMYNKLTMGDDYVETLEKKDIARRRLRNTLLYYITANRDEEAAKIAYNHYIKAKNMTDKLSGLRYLSCIPCKERDDAIQDFYKFANGDPLTLDKWFAIQASSDRHDCLDQVSELKDHSDFNAKNPNRCRSLFYSFGRNAPHFHRKDGKGYKFLAENILHIDKYNPQIAARACSFLIEWKKLDERYKRQMKKQLQRIYETPGLSNDTHEICAKGLAE